MQNLLAWVVVVSVNYSYCLYIRILENKIHFFKLMEIEN
jgi:hypothetical protein